MKTTKPSKQTAARDATSATKHAATKRAAKKPAKKPENGLSGFSVDVSAADGQAKFAALSRSRGELRRFSGAALDVSRQDPETAARNYLDQALESRDVRKFSRPVADGAPSEFKSIGTEVSPLTETTLVKFRQYINKIPVYGSLVVVELGSGNECLAINSSMGKPKAVDNVAKISPAQALAVAAQASGTAAGKLHQTPRLNYYFNQDSGKWRLAYIVEDVKQGKRKATGKGHADATLKDYVVDALNGKLLAALPRVATMAAVQESAIDALGQKRTLTVEAKGTKRKLHDQTLNITTYGFRFRDPTVDFDKLPGTLYAKPPRWPVEAVSAHANCAEVAHFLRDVVKRNNIDNLGGEMVSTVNCWDRADGTDTDKEWRNAYWNGEQMVYGQVAFPDGSLLSVASMLDVVAHELFHGITDATSRLEYRTQAGALNESYSDVFGVIIANYGKPIGKWTWEIGRDFDGPGTFLRSLSDPARFDQPAHMRDFRAATPPYTYNRNDYGWVHDNSGIHNHAAYRIMRAKRGSKFMFSPDQLAAMFFIALTVHLSRTSDFSDSRRAVLAATRSLFRKDAPATLKAKIAAVERAFASAGIK